tara:strand:- start:1240 stop:1587 length:348 start_codon:yes stop_codon:yes gene_type:complete
MSENTTDINSDINSNINSDTNYLSEETITTNLTPRLENNRLTGYIPLTKYEKTRILGSREKQLSLGSKPMIKLSEDKSYKEIAEKELEMKMTPMIIRRYLPDHTYEDWKISDLNQ